MFCGDGRRMDCGRMSDESPQNFGSVILERSEGNHHFSKSPIEGSSQGLELFLKNFRTECRMKVRINSDGKCVESAPAYSPRHSERPRREGSSENCKKLRKDLIELYKKHTLISVADI